MSNDDTQNLPQASPGREPEEDLSDLLNEWQYAQIRCERLIANKKLRRELIVILLSVLAVFAAPGIQWFHRWSLSGSLQLYAVLVLPLIAAWVWIARLRLAVPEIEPIRKSLKHERQTRMAPPK